MTETARPRRWSELAAPEIRELAPRAIALWPIGSTEQHGAHLVTGFDLASATAVVERAASALGDRAIVLPGLAFGSSDHWLGLGATLSLRPTTFVDVVADVARSIGEAGFRRLIVVNGHAGNVGPALTALAASRPTDPVVELVSYWALVDSAALQAACQTDAGGIGHAGEIETSIALHLGGLAIEERILDSSGVPLGDDRPGSRSTVFLRAPDPATESPTGVYGDPRPARPELGAFVVEQAADALARHCRDLLGQDSDRHA